MKYKQSHLLILASTLSFLGAPGVSDSTSILNFVATQSALAGQDDKPGTKPETKKNEKPAKQSFFKRLMHRAHVPTESRNHHPTDEDMGNFSDISEEFDKSQASPNNKVTSAAVTQGAQKPPANPTRAPLQNSASSVVPQTHVEPSIQSQPKTQTPVPQQEVAAVSVEQATEPQQGEREPRSSRRRAKRHFHQTIAAPTQSAAPLSAEIANLRHGLNVELTKTGREVQNMTQQLASLHQETCEAENQFNNCRRIENTQRERIEKVKAESQRAFVKLSLIENQDGSAAYLQDQLASHLIRSWTRSGKWAFLAIGNARTTLDHDTRRDIKKLVVGLNRAGYEILFDADSNEAEVIATAANGNALGISGRPALRTLGATSTVVIENPFLRMQAITAASKVIMTPDSVLGVGLLLEEFTTQDKFMVFDPDARWKKGLSSWQASLSDGHDNSSSHSYSSYSPSYSYDPQGNRYDYAKRDRDLARAKAERERAERERDKRPRNLGIRFPLVNEPKAYTKVSELLSPLTVSYWDSHKPKVSEYFSPGSAPYREAPKQSEPATFLASHLPLSILSLVDQIDGSVLQTQLTFTKTYHETVQKIRSHGQEHRFYNAGAAFFGSKDAPQDFEKMVKDVVEAAVKRGFPMTTGGSGGLMDTANRIAKGTEGYSIGIPCGGIAGETSANHLHDLNVSTNGYEQRIPLILLDKKLIMVAPGGSGTMKEVATTLVQIAAGEPSTQAHVMFIGLKYYDGLATFFNQVLPPAYLDEMSLVDSAHDFDLIFEKNFEQSSL